MIKEAGFYTLKLELFLETPTPDLLFMGSSRMRDAAVPADFAKYLSMYWKRRARVYNLGLAGAGSEEWFALATDFLHDPASRHVVIGFTGREISTVHEFRYASRFLWHFPHFLSYLKRTSYGKFRVKNVEFYIEQIICRFWYLFAQRDALSEWAEEYFGVLLGLSPDVNDPEDLADLHPKARADLKRKHVERRRLIRHVFAKDGYAPFLPTDWNLAETLKRNPGFKIMNWKELDQNRDNLSEDSVVLLKLTVDALREKGCKVALVETPVSPYLQELNPVLHGDYFRQWMAEHARELDVPFFPFPPEETKLTNDWYGDSSHLSEKGAKKYTFLLFEKLRNAGFFKEEKGP